MKKFFRVLLLIIVFSACGILSACGADRYKRLAFEVYYSFTQDGDNWQKVDEDNISIFYGQDNSPFTLTEDGNNLVGTVYLKVNVKGVKNKYIDKILVQNTGTGSSAGAGMINAGTMVDNNAVVPLSILLDAKDVGGDVINTTIKFTETSSNKNYQIGFNLTPTLKEMQTANITPLAVGVGGKSQINNNYVNFIPSNTLQKDVVYSLDSVGYFRNMDTVENGKISEYVAVGNSADVVVGENGLISVGTNYNVNNNNYVARVKATSKTDSEIFAYVYVYIVPRNINNTKPDVRFANGEQLENGNSATLYFGDEKYASATFNVADMTEGNSIYFGNGVQTSNPNIQAKYKLNVYVDNVKYNFDTLTDGTNLGAGLKGLRIEKLNQTGANNYKLTVVSNVGSLNKVEFKYELEGFNYDKESNLAIFSNTIDVNKAVLPTGFSANINYGNVSRTETFNEDTTINVDVYSTLQSVGLTLSAIPNSVTNANEIMFPFEGELEKLNITNLINNSATNGKTVDIKFLDGQTSAEISTKILITPQTFEGKVVEEKFVTVTFKLNYVVTASKVEAYADAGLSVPFNDASLNKKINIKVDGENNKFYLKVYYAGNKFDSSTISLTSTNPNIKFGKNGSTTIGLDNPDIVVEDSLAGYSTFAIPLYTNFKNVEGNIQVTVAGGLVTLPETSHTNIGVRGVVLANDSALDILIDGNNSSFAETKIEDVNNGHLNFAVTKNANHAFRVVDDKNDNSIINVLGITTNNSFVGSGFSLNALEQFTPTGADKNSWSNFFSFYAKNNSTQVINVLVEYYSDEAGFIKLKENTIVSEFAVFTPVSGVEVDIDNNSIGYIEGNPDGATANIKYNALNANLINNAPTKQIVFSNGTDDVSNAIVKTNVNSINVGYVRGEDLILGVPNDIEGVVITSTPNINNISGEVSVKLNKLPTLGSVTINFVVERFGQKVDSTRTATIQFKVYEKADFVDITGDSIDNSVANTNYLNLSTINTLKQTATFNAQARWKKENADSLRLNKLDYQLYIFQQDGEGNLQLDANNMPIAVPYKNTGVVVENVDGKFTVSATNGGVFKLVVGSVDSCKVVDGVKQFATSAEIIINVSDGSLANPYTINKVEDLKELENSNAYFVLNKNIVVDMSAKNENGYEFKPIQGFDGTLTGTRKLVTANGVAANTFAITLYLDVANSINGNSGLFATLNQNGIVKDLNMFVTFIGKASGVTTGSNLGAIAGINNGNITNVNLNILASNKVELEGNLINFGGYAGVNNFRIDLSTATLMQNSLTITSKTSVNYGGVVGVNNGEIVGGYMGKTGLNNVSYSAILNTHILNTINGKQYFVGAVAGINNKGETAENGLIKNLIVGGNIVVEDYVATTGGANTYVGGITGNSNATIQNCAVLGLNLFANTNTNYVAGVLAQADNATILDCRVLFVGVKYTNLTNTVYGEIEGKNVAGILADGLADISYCTVESFVSIYEDFYPLYGLYNVAGIALSEATINNSFVYANLKVKETNNLNSILLGNGTINNSYFIGRVNNNNGFDATKLNGTINKNNKVYGLVLLDNVIYSAGDNLNYTYKLDHLLIQKVEDINLLFDLVASPEVDDIGSYYVLVDGKYFKATGDSLVAGTNYYTFNLPNYKVSADNQRDIVKTSYNEQYNESAIYYNINEDYINSDIYTIYYKNGEETVIADTNKFNLDTQYFVGHINNGKAITASEFRASVLPGISNGLEGWQVNNRYNIINFGATTINMPYLTKDNLPLMIIGPSDLNISVNQEYVEKISSNYIKDGFEFDINNIIITETVLVNYFAVDETGANAVNTHKLVAENGGKGLLSLEILPTSDGVSGGVMFEVVSGGAYATTDGANITFLGASNATPIVVRCYSTFNSQLSKYAVFFTEYGATKLVVEGSNAYVDNLNRADYAVDLVAVTDSNKSTVEIGFNTLNIFEGVSYNSIIKNGNNKLKNSLKIVAEEQVLEGNKILNIQQKATDNLKVLIGLNGETDKTNALVNFKLMLDVKQYFGNNYFAEQQFVEIGRTSVYVNIFKSADSINVDEHDFTIKTGATLNLTAYLQTSYVDSNINTSGVVDTVTNGSSNLVVYDNRLSLEYPNKDGINFEFVGADEQSVNELERIINVTGANNIPSLFNVSIVVKYVKGFGYEYDIQFTLKNEFNYRYLENIVNLKLNIYAQSNNKISTLVNIQLQPATLTGVRIENYEVSNSKPANGYQNYITSAAESSIIEPAGMGGVMIARLQPSYADVKSVTITSEALYVPINNENVYINFEQLIFDKATGVYRTIPTVGEPIVDANGKTMGIPLQLISALDENGNYYYDGIIYIHTYIKEVGGLEKQINVNLNVTTSTTTIIESKTLTTKFVPQASLSTQNESANYNGAYLIQEGTNNSSVSIDLKGYEFSKTPTIVYEWVKYQNGEWVKFEPTYTEKDDNQNEIVKKYNVSDYITYYFNYDDVTEDSYGWYHLPVNIVVGKNVPYAFRINASLYVTSSLGSKNENASLVFIPTDYILTGVSVENLVSGQLNVRINQNKQIELGFNTQSASNFSADIYNRLIEDLTNEAKSNQNIINKVNEINNNNNFSEEQKQQLINQLYASFIVKMFSINGGDLSNYENNFECSFNNNYLNILGKYNINNKIDVKVPFGYEQVKEFDSEGNEFVKGYTLKFNTNFDKEINTSFVLDIRDNSSEEVPIPIYTAEEFVSFMQTGESENYILMNDITLTNYTPISANIASLDGNNRIIYISSFAVDSNRTNYGLFDSISTYQDRDGVTQKTILKNVIVSYNKTENSTGFELNLANSDANLIVFGGLVAVNNGGLIYNCEIINFIINNNEPTFVLTLKDSQDVNLIFGGLVGENNGIITNSRVGRKSYERVNVSSVGSTTTNLVTAQEIVFSIGHKQNINDNSRFSAVVAGFVGVNQKDGIIASSYVANTSVINYSNSANNNRTAGFVGTNSGNINSSYVKAKESTISPSQPYSTGKAIESKGNGTVAGFVHLNNGNINNSFANTEVVSESNFVSGFVYENAGEITESYAACTLSTKNQKASAKQPFVGTNDKEDILNSGIVENCYFYNEGMNTEQKKNDTLHAVSLNATNFQESENLRGFVFINSNNVNERNQGVWNYYLVGDYSKHILPEINSANIIAVSRRYLLEDGTNYANAAGYDLGGVNNPYIIRNSSEFNQVFTAYTTRSFAGYVRLINNIDLSNGEINTRTNFTLGDDKSVTSIEGNGMTISGIVLDNTASNIEKTGLFAEIKNAYIKNFNLSFNQRAFSTLGAKFSGGLAGTIKDSIISNIHLNGSGTTINASNFAGGLAGLIDGKSIIMGISTNLNAKVNSGVVGSNNLYYNYNEYLAMQARGYNVNTAYSKYLETLSYAGAVAGVIDLTERNNYIKYNLAYIDIEGTTMAKTGNDNYNFVADFAGGVAGYMGRNVNAIRLKYNVGNDNVIQGRYASGGLFGVALGSVTASQVTAEEDTQLNYDKIFAEYIIALESEDSEVSANASLNLEEVGNTNLVRSSRFAGGLFGIGIGATINSCYSRAGLSGVVLGGLIGESVSSSMYYSYGMPYINFNNNWKYVGGLIGDAFGVGGEFKDTPNEYQDYLLNIVKTGVRGNSIQNSFGSFNTDVSKLQNNGGVDGCVANYLVGCCNHITSGITISSPIIGVYAGGVKAYGARNVDNAEISLYKGFQNINTNNLQGNANLETDYLLKLYDLSNPGHVETFQTIFGNWRNSYWSVDVTKYFPLLIEGDALNYIPIYTESDLAQILNNPSGNFMVMQDIELKEEYTNYVLNVNFTGRLVGNLDYDHIPTIKYITINASNTTSSGFFKQTTNANINNLQFSYGRDNRAGVIVSAQTGVFGGVSALDIGSEFSNVFVNSHVNNGKTQKVLQTNTLNGVNGTISGFGGIVGNATNTSIFACTFAGNVDAKLKADTSTDINFGGLVASGAYQSGGNDDTNTIINFTVTDGVVGADDIETKFNLDLEGSANIGGIIGNGGGVLASAKAGKNIKLIEFNISGSATTLNFGGAAGSITNGNVNNVQTYTVLNNNTEATKLNISNSANIGGLVGKFNSSDTANAINSSLAHSNYNLQKVELNDDAELVVSLGVAVGSNLSLNACMFNGNISNESSNPQTDIKLNTLKAGGALGVGINYTTISEVITAGQILMGAKKHISMGGLVGEQTDGKLTILNSLTTVRLIPFDLADLQINSDDTTNNLYLGGIVGNATECELVAGLTISLTSIITDGIVNDKIKYFNNVNALFGAINNLSKFNNIFYSSDYALFTERNDNGESKKLYNLSAQTLTRAGGNGSSTSSWKHAFVENANLTWMLNNNMLPYPTSLQSYLVDLGYLSVDVNTNYNFMEGSVFKPVYFTGTVNQDNYSYYILSGNYKLADEKGLTGILMGADNYQGSTTDKAILTSINKHSAASNIHVVLSGEINNYADSGIITNINNGVIANCSVSGNGVTLAGSSENLGLIAGTNNGLVSFAYSSLEITNALTNVAGIVYNNAGKIYTTYFTGYINNKNKVASGVVAANGENSFVFNSYMAGVIENVSSSGNSFAAEISNFEGNKNFIDCWANSEADVANETNIKYGEKDIGIAYNKSTNISKAEGFVNNYWTTVWENDVIDTNKQSYGHNFSYPIIKFSKREDNLNVNDVQNICYTGNGGSADETINIGTANGTTNWQTNNETRISKLLTNDETYYYNAYKIPHFGVLANLNYLPQDLNYVIIYNLDGKIINSDNNKNISWNSINNKEISENSSKIVAFRGVVVSNKNFNLTTGEETRCIISNFNTGSIFDNVQNSGFSNLIFAGNINLTTSGGVLARNISNDTNIKDITNNYVLVSNIALGYKNTEDKNIDLSITGANEATTDVNLGGLFGAIKNTTVNIVNLFTLGDDEEQEQKEIGHVSIEGKSANEQYVGLIAGTNNSGIITIEGSSNLYAIFNGASKQIIGGLIGSNSTGSITSKEVCTLNFAMSGIGTSSDSAAYTKTFGGIFGKASGDTNADYNAENFAVKFNKEDQKIRAENFGGLVAINESGTIKFNNCTIASNVNVLNNKYFGLISANIAGVVDVNGFGVNDKDVNGTIEIDLMYQGMQNGSETLTDGGVGGLVGELTGSLQLNSAINNQFNYSLISSGVRNVGGLVGNYTSGKVNINKNIFIEVLNLQGSANVGGAFGLATANIDNEAQDDNGNVCPSYLSNNADYWKFMSAEKLFATITVNGKENFGGLIGSFTGSSLKNIKNYNKLVIGTGFYNNLTSKNIGGVIGNIVNSTIVQNLTNNGTITYTRVNNNVTVNKNGMVFSIVSPTNGSETVNMATNVGGVIGAITNKNSETTNQIEILNINNLADIEGYQNVGGLIGFVNVEAGTITLSTYKEGNNNETENTETKVVENINNAEVYGVINVGGAVGLVDSGKNAHNASITNTTNRANVYGNANVGGLIGYNNLGVITNNKVTNINDEQNTSTEDATLTKENNSTLLVKGIVYQAVLKDNVQVNYVPSNVGGLIGFGVNSQVKNNNLNNVLITSTEEGVNNTVISTISNHMVETIDESGQLNGGVTDKNSTLQLVGEDNKIAFNNIKSGYGLLMGGTYGGINKSATEESTKQSANNIITDSYISAKLGVNVGTLFGYYSYLKLANETLPLLMSQIEGIVTLASTQQQNANLNVDGAYNIGGIFGYLDNDTPVTLQQNNETQVLTSNNKIKVTLQANSTGMYVGGLVGKMNGTSDDNLKISSNSGNVSIQIDTTNSYYMGGLVGRYEVGSEGANFNGHVGDYTFNEKHEVPSSENTQITTSAITELNSISEFGGLIGMLKVAYTGDSVSTTINGYHQYAFTINTIENSNYYDANSDYKAIVSEGEYYLQAIAAYVNRDNFKIVPTNNTAWYRETNGKKPNNPLVTNSTGWAKDYTMFKTMQRNIPALTENNKNSLNSGTAEWDAVSQVYDATFITYVATIDSLGLSSRTSLAGLTKPESSDTYDPDYICFTIYEEFTGQAKLYSAIGVATPYLNDEGDYATPPNEEQSSHVLQNIGTLLGLCPVAGGHYYINLGADGDNSQFNALTGLWGHLGDTGEFKTTKNSITYNQLRGSGADEPTFVEGLVNSGAEPIYVDYAYKVQNFKQADEKTKDTWFVFELIYGGKQAESGSIFAANGVYSNNVDSARMDGENANEWMKYAGVVVDVVITAATLGGGAIAAHGAKAAAKLGGKLTAKTLTKNLAKQAGKKGLKSVLSSGFKGLTKVAFKTLGVAVVARFSTLMLGQLVGASLAQDNFFKTKDQTLGFLAPAYTREIQYDDNKLLTQTDSIRSFGAQDYVYYSTIRPSDYYKKYYYLDFNINLDDDNLYDEDGNLLDSVFPETSYTDKDDKKLEIGKNIDTATKEEYPDLYNGKPCKAYRYYEYSQGVYYKIMDEVDITLTPTQLFNEDDFEKNYDYINKNGYYYVRGKFEGSKYEYDSAPGINNNLKLTTDADGKIDIDGEEYTHNINLFEENTLKFSPVYKGWDGRETPIGDEEDGISISIEGNILNYNIQKAEDVNITITTKNYYSGYGYIQGAYYAANGNNYNGEFVKYGTFAIDTTGTKTTEGLTPMQDYIQLTEGEHTYIYYLIDVTDPTNETKYNINNLPSGNLAGINSFVCELYPKSFVNIYENNSYITNKQNLKDSEYYVEETLLGKTDGIDQQVEYYYYNAGFVKQTIKDDEGKETEQVVVTKLELKKGLSQEEYDKKTATNKSKFYDYDSDAKVYYLKTITIYNPNDNNKPFNISPQKLLKELNTYANYYIDDMFDAEDDAGYKSQKLVKNNYFNVNDELYVRTEYLISGGLTCSVDINFFENEAGIANYNYNKYLCDPAHDIYTRYKYNADLSTVKFEASDGKTYKLYEDNRRRPNYGTTYLIESVRVILSGNGTYQNVQGSNQNVTIGSIGMAN